MNLLMRGELDSSMPLLPNNSNLKGTLAFSELFYTQSGDFHTPHFTSVYFLL